MDVGRNLLEDKSDTEETHWGRGLDSNVERGEKRGKGAEGRALLGRGFWQADEWPQRERSRETLKDSRGSPGKG